MSAIKNLPENTESQKNVKNDLLQRAKAVGLDDNATEAQVVSAEKDKE